MEDMGSSISPRRIACRFVVFLVAACLVYVLPGCAHDVEDTGVVDTVEQVVPLELFNLRGERVAPFADRKSRAIVFLFARIDCPISNRYAPQVQRLHAKFASRGIAFLSVFPDPDETASDIRKHVEEYQYPFEALRDPQQTLVTLAQVSVTPEAAVFTNGRLVYRGRINNWYVDFGQARAAPTKHDLADALEAILDGRPVPTAVTQAIGCPIPPLP